MKLSQDFRKARRNCEKDGADLATFHNENEEIFFRNNAYNHCRFGYRKFRVEKGNILDSKFVFRCKYYKF